MGMETPLDEMPVLSLEESIYYDDFNILSSCRTYGMVENSLTVTDIISYANFSSVPDKHKFLLVMIKLDSLYQKIASQEREKRQKSRS